MALVDSCGLKNKYTGMCWILFLCLVGYFHDKKLRIKELRISWSSSFVLIPKTSVVWLHTTVSGWNWRANTRGRSFILSFPTGKAQRENLNTSWNSEKWTGNIERHWAQSSLAIFKKENNYSNSSEASWSSKRMKILLTNDSVDTLSNKLISHQDRLVSDVLGSTFHCVRLLMVICCFRTEFYSYNLTRDIYVPQRSACHCIYTHTCIYNLILYKVIYIT